MDETYRVGNSIVLTAGRKTSSSDESRGIGEGVALVLSSKAKDAWNEGGTKWKAWNLGLIIVATLALGKHRNALCCAPTF